MPNTSATFAAVAEVLERSCGALSCHGGGEEGQDLVLTDVATLHDTLLTEVVGACNDKARVT